MGLGTDLEAAANEPYHAMQDAASCGDDDDGWSAACSARVGNKRCFLIVALLSALVIIGMSTLTYRAPSFSVDLTGYDGIDPGHAARVVSPSFNVTLRANHGCVDSADVAVTYSGVALGWASVAPWHCARDVKVVARGGMVGLSRRLRERMASEWRLGTLELDVDVKLYHKGRRAETDPPQRMVACKVGLMDKEDSHASLLGHGNLCKT